MRSSDTPSPTAAPAADGLVADDLVTERPAAQRPAADGLARPHDFGRGDGDGLQLGVSLGGGGVFFVAWQLTYLYELGQRGVDLARADRVVGTSAGSLVASILEAGSIGRLHRELQVLAKLPRLLGALAPSADLHPSQERARDLFGLAADAEPATIRTIGHAALAAQAPSPSVMPRNISVVLASRRWPSDRLHVTCVDAYTGERCVITRAAGVRVARAVAASSAVPGLFAPQPILDRRCMDGGVSGTGIHLDLLAGAARSVVLCLTDGKDIDVGRMTSPPGAIDGEVGALEASGSAVFFRTPETMDVEKLMDPAAVPEAMAMARRQAAADVDELRTFLS